jgi:hypothetical protein
MAAERRDVGGKQRTEGEIDTDRLQEGERNQRRERGRGYRG